MLETSSSWLNGAAVQSEKQDEASDRPQSLEMIANLDQDKERNPEVLTLEEFTFNQDDDVSSTSSESLLHVTSLEMRGLLC